MDARHRFIRRVEGAHAAIAAVAVGVAVAMAAQPVWTGVLLGALLGGLNFRALSMLAARFTRTDDAGARSGAMGLIIAKMGAMMGAVGAIMVFAKPDVGGFLIGISGVPVALIAVAALARPTFENEPLPSPPTNAEVQQ